MSAVANHRTAKELALLQGELMRQQRAAEDEQRAAEVLARYREPFASAAFDLQSRLYNMLDQRFMEEYARADSSRRDMALNTTLFRVAQYFGWGEILREEIQFLRFPVIESTRRVSDLQAHINQLFSTDRLDGGRFMLWRDEQRALGELMIDRTSKGPRCLGYAGFRAQYDDTFRPWCGKLEEDLRSGEARNSARLQLAQHKLCELVAELDKDIGRYRFKLSQRPLSVEGAREELQRQVGPSEEERRIERS